MRTVAGLLVLCVGFATLGCSGGGGTKGINVTGKATLDGTPLTRGEVVLAAEQGDVIRQGTIQKDGTFSVPDIPAGKYKVALRIDPYSEEDYDEGPMGKKTLKKGVKPMNVPPKLQDHTQSGLATEVVSGREIVVNFVSK